MFQVARVNSNMIKAFVATKLLGLPKVLLSQRLLLIARIRAVHISPTA